MIGPVGTEDTNYSWKTAFSWYCIILLMSTKTLYDAIYRKLLSLLKQMREDSGMSQRALSRKLRKPLNWVFRIETGRRRIDIFEFAAWAAACDDDPIRVIKILARFCDRNE